MRADIDACATRGTSNFFSGEQGLTLAQLGEKTADLATKQRAESSVGESATSDRNQ